MEKIAVIGSGTMGNGIAQSFAQAGFSVTLYDVSDPALEKAMQTIGRNLDRMLGREIITENQKITSLAAITPLSVLEQAVSGASLVVEAATENKAVKLEIFKDLDRLCPPGCILASNTSSISITEIASVTNRAQSVIGMHFMNPVQVMMLVEIISGYNTSAETLEFVTALSRRLGKIPVSVKDYPGFVANRILMPMINESIFTLYEGVAGIAEIDTVMKTGMSHPMGPLQLADFIGLDVCLAILKVMHEGFGNPRYAPCPLLQNMVNARNLGVKTGRGFYDYSGGGKELKPAFQLMAF